MKKDDAVLKRTLSLPLITLYGMGTILGAGIYVLMGKVVGHAGYFTPLSFLLAAVIAVFTGLSYAELSSRFPKSAGEAVYIENGFPYRWLAPAAGLLVVIGGTLSAAAIANGFSGYLATFWQPPEHYVIIALVLSLGGLAVLGIAESVGAATLITLIEIGGLLFVAWVASNQLLVQPTELPQIDFSPGSLPWSGIFAGSFLAFYAFIGFEDMVNVAEEVIEPRKNLPLSIVIAISASTAIYVIVSIVSVLAVNPSILASSDAPLAEIIKQHGGFSPQIISLISLLAVINGALIQIIMASRVLYGLANKHHISQWFGRINPSTQTPIRATLFVTFFVLILALWFPIEKLAELTSFITLTVFMFVNIALIRIKRSKTSSSAGVKSYSIVIPIIGALLCAMMLILNFLS